MRSQNETLIGNQDQLMSSYKKLESEIARMRASSTINFGSAHHAASPESSPHFVTANLDSTLNRLLESYHLTSPSQPQPTQSTSNESTSQSAAALSSNEPQEAHALASVIMSLTERRKHLPELPEFNGNGAEWLCFRNSYHKLKQQGKFDDDEMIAKLRKALKGPAFNYARLWLFSAKSNPGKIISDLEEKFFCPSTIVSDSLEAIAAIPSIKEKTRSSIEKLKRAVDEYINVCTDVDETIHLTGRVPCSIEDKLPDDLNERWNKARRIKEITRGDWYDFSSFLTNATLDLRIREPERPKSKTSSASVKINVTQSNSPAKPQFTGHLPPCDYDDCGKYLFRCAKFASIDPEDRFFFCREKGYCIKCLRKHPIAPICPNIKLIPSCRAPKCEEPFAHTTLMHPPDHINC